MADNGTPVRVPDLETRSPEVGGDTPSPYIVEVPYQDLILRLEVAALAVVVAVAVAAPTKEEREGG